MIPSPPLLSCESSVSMKTAKENPDRKKLLIVKRLKLLKSAQVKQSINNACEVSKPEIFVKGREKISCRHEIQVREEKGAEKKAKQYQ